MKLETLTGIKRILNDCFEAWQCLMVDRPLTDERVAWILTHVPRFRASVSNEQCGTRYAGWCKYVAGVRIGKNARGHHTEVLNDSLVIQGFDVDEFFNAFKPICRRPREKGGGDRRSNSVQHLLMTVFQFRQRRDQDQTAVTNPFR